MAVRSGFDTNELFYVQPDTPTVMMVMLAEFAAEPDVVPGARRELFEALFTGAQGRMYDVSPNGERFLMLRDGANLSEDVPQPQIIVVENWFEELKERVPVP